MLSSTISLKPVSESAEDFVQVVAKAITDGVLRRDIAVARPAKSELLIRHQPRGQGAQIGQNHIISLQKVVTDAAGVLYPYTVSVSLTIPDNVTVTNAKVYDSLRQLVDFFATTAPVTIDTSRVDSILAGEA